MLRNALQFWAICLLFLLSNQTVKAVSLPKIFGSHMVLQQNAEITMWGWGNPSEEITVTSSWNQEAVKTKASNLAQWQVKLKTPAAGGPFTIMVKGHNAINLEDVLIGEVWLCSGQSNMEWTTNAGIDNGAAEIPKANFPSIRFFTVPRKSADGAQLDVDGQWVVCTPQTMPYFSAVGYFFGRQIHQNLSMPVGLINSSWGGTPAEVWVNPQAIAKSENLVDAAAKLKEVPWGPVRPGKAYNAMIAPLIPFRLAGALWYQGEANVSDPGNYAQLLPALIQNWRQEWSNDFPFYYVQLAPYKYGRPHEGAMLREAQRRTLTTPNTGMIVISDIGNKEDIHPRNKIDVGLRLANLALAKTYGKKDIVYSGPLYRSMKVEGNKIRVSFDHAESGLVVKNGKELTDFEIAGSDQKFVKASARISGKTIIVQAPEVKDPVAVRFAWDNIAEPNLFNKAGLPASTFHPGDNFADSQ
ncbi:sialate O-acetylesterase [Adhaeribacter radiodurans]|uniref:Sialate O-acetylesterase n=1 Tax=Adhaeribacter radiodurans TaxID=2745197 RepID=A0A7L7LAQ4_9BACT|nr:sialate O-acetylesterase [Adhaeribacter radiodurans]QMU29499.1 sialate O-acetylesterase [Adhaeribacter radiodurans]